MSPRRASGRRVFALDGVCGRLLKGEIVSIRRPRKPRCGVCVCGCGGWSCSCSCGDCCCNWSCGCGSGSATHCGVAAMAATGVCSKDPGEYSIVLLLSCAGGEECFGFAAATACALASFLSARRLCTSSLNSSSFSVFCFFLGLSTLSPSTSASSSTSATDPW